MLYWGKVSKSPSEGRWEKGCYYSLGLSEVAGVQKREWRAELIAKWNFKSEVNE